MTKDDPWPDMDFTIVQDYREKKPWDLGDRTVEVDSLETGDYTIKGMEESFAVERKSLDDLANSMGNKRESFEAECQRADVFDHPMHILIEDQRWKVANYMSKGHTRYYYSRLPPATIINTIPSWEDRYNVKFMWCGNRPQAAYECIYYLGLWNLDNR